jgi:hypothetical protein
MLSSKAVSKSATVMKAWDVADIGGADNEDPSCDELLG